MSEKEKNAKLKVLELTLGKLEKSYGKGVVMKLGDKIDNYIIPLHPKGITLFGDLVNLEPLNANQHSIDLFIISV